MSTGPFKSDIAFLVYFSLVLIFGLIFLTSASSVIGFDKFHDTYFFVKHQLLYGVLPGFAGLLFFSKLDYQKLRSWSPMLFIGSLLLLVLVFIPGLGSALNTGNRSWVVLPWFSFQPSEFAKFALIIYFSAFLAKIGPEIKNFKEGFLTALGVAMIPVVFVMLQPDIGTMAILCFIIFGLLFIADSKMSHMSLLTGAAVLGFIVLIFVAPYRLARFTTFLHPDLDPQGIGYHINQSFIAIGSGGFFGSGLGQSRQKYQYLPEVQADSIFAIIAEEMGFFLTLGFLALFLLFVQRGLKIAKASQDVFARFLVTGIMIWFVGQAFLNIAAMVGLMPLTGVPLPFVSYGGTALVVALSAVGLILNVSKHSKI
ncbi:MAG: cell division protein FtsW [Candidatus Magasanikbacteria bacterium RIFCSPHIGHO2_02_FULL_41_13]|uniref:Probable peptidoglycan glycosyltransferase FtsW n=1 Tax=Candidatus Magasanikbacteria bacterium RIFCSPHIGHO2_02_FULL_41_13 TaxID=1798676 RepID=A0A1F6M524_9BACT|nr:MAG: cell division protein FtsW [Candidatus Magasanikbacteria bacterium RIFCSPHIGHO2_02_FULL_41_13]